MTFNEPLQQYLAKGKGGEIDLQPFIRQCLDGNKSDEATVRREILVALIKLESEGAVIIPKGIEQKLTRKHNRKYFAKPIVVAPKYERSTEIEKSKKGSKQPLYELLCIVLAYVLLALSWASDHFYSKPLQDRAADVQKRIDFMTDLLRQYGDGDESALSHKWHKDSLDEDLYHRDLLYSIVDPATINFVLHGFESESCRLYPIPRFFDSRIEAQKVLNKIISDANYFIDNGKIESAKNMANSEKSQYQYISTKLNLYPGQKGYQTMNWYKEVAEDFNLFSICALIAGTLLLTSYKVLVWRRERKDG